MPPRTSSRTPSKTRPRNLGKLWKTEAIAGLTTFLTMAYILVVNPAILSTPGTGLSFSAVLTATVLLSFISTLLMGVYAKLPYAVAPGMGLNAFFTYSLVLGEKIPAPQALGMVFWSGVLFLLLSVLPIREKIILAIPKSIRVASSIGIGLFLTFIGLKNAGIIVSHPVTFVTIGKANLDFGIFFFGFFLALFFHHRKNSVAFLLTIFAVTAIQAFRSQIAWPESLVAKPDFSLFLQADFVGSLKLSLLPAILSIMLTDLFDSLSTFMGLSQAAGLVDKRGEPLNVRRGLIVDSIATLLGGVLGTSPGTAYIESASGIEAGGRTGNTALVTAFLFLPCLFLAPLMQLVPALATAPVLVVVGYFMFRSFKDLNITELEESVPAFLTMILIPLTFSITQGLLCGIVAYVILCVVLGKTEKLSLMTFVLGGVSLAALFLHG